jgi:hypothetical protein
VEVDINIRSKNERQKSCTSSNGENLEVDEGHNTIVVR